MIIEVHLYTQAEPCRFEGVRNAYQKGDLYCVWTLLGPIYKFPMQHIFRIKEMGNPQHINPVKKARK